MKTIGILKPKISNAIKSSKIGVGFECLDRKMWEDVDEVYEYAVALGAKHARIQSGWGRTEVVAGEYDFRWIDRVVDKLQDGGVQPWINLGYGNILYTDAREPDACGWAPLYTEKARTGWKNYITALVSHFQDRITHYEVWNEPCGREYWLPGPPNAKEYVELVRITAETIRAMQPDAKIMGGNDGTNLWFAGDIEECLRHGLGKYLDIYTYHRYRVMPELETPELIAFFRDIFRRNGVGHIELWQGESGFPSKRSDTEALAGVEINEAIQAKMLSRSILTDLYAESDYTSYFTMSDFTCYYKNGFRDKPNYFGLLTTDRPPRRKPAYYVFQRICSLFDVDTERDRTSLAALEACNSRAEEDRFLFHEKQAASNVVTFKRKDHPMIVWWHKVSGLKEHEPYPVNLLFWSSEKQFRDPVLVDLMTGEILECDFIREKPDYRIKALDIPLKDYPMILIDRAALAGLEGTV